jgi:hypothetical protein
MATFSPEQDTPGWSPPNDFDKAAIQQQIEHLLSSPLFHSSKRYPQFLRFVVSRALEGQTDQLKERILGIEIFDRPADYDTNKDPIVRVTAAEIRKRIEQYYQDPKHNEEIRLFLPSGSYAPHFFWPGPSAPSPGTSLELPANGALEAEPHRALPIPAAPLDLKQRFAASKQFRGRTVQAVLAVVLISAAVVWGLSRPSVMDKFWEPFVKSPEPVLFCLADQSQYANIRLRDATDPERETELPDTMVTVIIDDVSPVVNIAGLLRTYGKTYRVLGESTTSLTDLRRGPAVFIGAFDNSWTLRFTSSLRFHFMNDPSMLHLRIEDRENPSKREWVLNRPEQQMDTYKDYAIVARFLDPDTDQMAVVAAGIGRGGTVAAGEFLVDPRRMEQMLKQAPPDWSKKNIEVVLETDVIQGRSSPPHVSAVYVW